MTKKMTKDTHEILKGIGKRPTNALISAELLEHIMDKFGGPSAFAAAFHTEYGRAAAGGVVRARMLSDVFRLFQSNTVAQKGHANSVEGMSDDELRAALRSLLGDEPSAPNPTP